MTKYDEVPTRALGTRLGLIEDLSHAHSVPPVYANKRIGNDWHISVPVQGNGYHFCFQTIPWPQGGELFFANMCKLSNQFLLFVLSSLSDWNIFLSCIVHGLENSTMSQEGFISVCQWKMKSKTLQVQL